MVERDQRITCTPRLIKSEGKPWFLRPYDCGDSLLRKDETRSIPHTVVVVPFSFALDHLVVSLHLR